MLNCWYSFLVDCTKTAMMREHFHVGETVKIDRGKYKGLQGEIVRFTLHQVYVDVGERGWVRVSIASIAQ